MGLISLVVRNFRNIAEGELAFSPHFNLITGSNGAGKTSVLEALFFLGRAQSFRTTHTANLIREGSQALLVTGKLKDRYDTEIPFGIERDKSSARVHMAGKPVRQLSELVAHFPFQLLNPDSHQFLEGGPRHRRRFLDWGVFHVEPSFFPTWQRYSRAIRQRNAALRAGASVQEIRLWDPELVSATEILDQLRRRYVEKLIPVLTGYLGELVDIDGLRWDYRPGWSQKLSYSEALTESLEGDRRQGFTRIGPHRADLMATLDGLPAQERVSRGQQKQIVVAMMLAQARVFRQEQGRACLFLIDDLASELDSDHRARVLAQLHELQAQIFLTAIDATDIDTTIWPDHRRFHVEHGQIEEVIY